MKIYSVRVGGGLLPGDTAVLYYEDQKRGGRTETGVPISSSSTPQSVASELAVKIGQHFCAGVFKTSVTGDRVLLVVEDGYDLKFGTKVEHPADRDQSDDDGAEVGFTISEV